MQTEVGEVVAAREMLFVSAEAVVEHFETVMEQLRVACFCTCSRDLAGLRGAALQAD